MRVFTSVPFSSERLPQYSTAITVSVIAVACGVVQGWASPTLPLLRSSVDITVEQESWLGSLAFLGAFASSPAYSYINHRLGRKAAGYLSAVPLIAGWLIMTFGNSVTLLCIARFITGLSLSGINVFATLYVSEVSEDRIRGALVNLRGLAVDSGIIFVYLLGPYLSIQNMAAVCISFPIVFLFSYLWLPESPLFLMASGADEKALESILWLRGGDAGRAQEEMRKLKSVVSEAERVSVRELLRSRGTRRALVIALVLVFAHQFSGMNVVFSYSTSIFEATGSSSLSPQLSSLVFSVVNFLGSLFTCTCVDLAGRRPILLATQVCQGICLGGLGGYFFARHHDVDLTSLGCLPVVALSLYCFCVVAGPASLFYVVLSETFRPEARGLATGVTSSFMWMLAFLSTKFYSALTALLGAAGCFWLFAAVSFAGALFTYFQIPETRNRSLESILTELDGNPQQDYKSARENIFYIYN